MEVLIAHPLDPSQDNQGGSIRYVLYLINELLENKINTKLLGVKFIKQTFQHPNFFFIPIEKLKIGKNVKWHTFLIKLFLKSPFLKINSSTIIHTMRLDLMLPFVLFFPNNPKVMVSDEPLHYAVEAFGFFYPAFERIYNLFEKLVLKNIDVIITDTRTEKYFIGKYPWVKKKIILMSTSGVDPEKFKVMNKEQIRKEYGYNINDNILLFVGRLEKIKNIDLIIKSLKLAENQIKGIKLIIVGNGPERDKLEKLSRKNGLDNVIFMGLIEHNILPEIYNLADILVLSSIIEGSPTVVREALSCGVPVVSTDVGDVKTILSEYTGRIVESDKNSFSNGIIEMFKLLEDSEYLIKEECIKSAKKFDIHFLMKEVIGLYYQIK